MKELLAIIDDVRRGVVKDDLLDFAMYVLGRAFWVLFAVILVGAGLIVFRGL